MVCRLRFDDGIGVFGLQPEILWALDRAVEVWDGYDQKYVTVTSARGGRHSLKSLHNAGLAADIRRWEIDGAEFEDMVLALSVALGPAFDCVLENTHLHIEYQPKGEQQYLTVLAA